MRRTLPRFLAAGAAFVAACLLVSACDASPYAANVNGQVVSQLALNNQLKQYAANQAFVSSLSSGNNLSVAGSGGSGTYSKTFVNVILTRLVVDMIVSQHLEATNSPPPPDAYQASRAIWELTGSSYWSSFPASIRSSLVQQSADLAQLVPASTLAPVQSQLHQAYLQIQPYLFSQLCVVQASAFNHADAQALAANGVVNGSHLCFSQAQFEEQPAAYQNAVRPLKVGQVSQPITTSYGYSVVKLTSRQSPGETPAVQKTIYAATTQPTQLPGFSAVVKAARIKINPAYGTWNSSSVSISPPPTTGS